MSKPTRSKRRSHNGRRKPKPATQKSTARRTAQSTNHTPRSRPLPNGDAYDNLAQLARGFDLTYCAVALRTQRARRAKRTIPSVFRELFDDQGVGKTQRGHKRSAFAKLLHRPEDSPGYTGEFLAHYGGRLAIRRIPVENGDEKLNDAAIALEAFNGKRDSLRSRDRHGWPTTDHGTIPEEFIDVIDEVGRKRPQRFRLRSDVDKALSVPADDTVANKTVTFWDPDKRRKPIRCKRRKPIHRLRVRRRQLGTGDYRENRAGLADAFKIPFGVVDTITRDEGHYWHCLNGRFSIEIEEYRGARGAKRKEKRWLRSEFGKALAEWRTLERAGRRSAHQATRTPGSFYPKSNGAGECNLTRAASMLHVDRTTLRNFRDRELLIFRPSDREFACTEELVCDVAAVERLRDEIAELKKTGRRTFGDGERMTTATALNILKPWHVSIERLRSWFDPIVWRIPGKRGGADYWWPSAGIQQVRKQLRKGVRLADIQPPAEMPVDCRVEAQQAPAIAQALPSEPRLKAVARDTASPEAPAVPKSKQNLRQKVFELSQCMSKDAEAKGDQVPTSEQVSNRWNKHHPNDKIDAKVVIDARYRYRPRP